MRKKKIKTKPFSILIFLLALYTISTLLVHILYPLSYREYIKQYSQEYELDPFLVAAVINVESKYHEEATSSKNARGLMQIGEQTGQWASEELNIEDYEENLLYDPETNIRIGTWYLNKLNKEFRGNLDLVLAAYNGGSGNVNKWLKSEEYSKDGESLDQIPFQETENYLKKVKLNYSLYRRFYKKEMHKVEKSPSLYKDTVKKIRDYIRSF